MCMQTLYCKRYSLYFIEQKSGKNDKIETFDLLLISNGVKSITRTFK